MHSELLFVPDAHDEAVSFDVPNAIYELLAGNVAVDLNAASSRVCDEGPGSGSRLMSQEDFSSCCAIGVGFLCAHHQPYMTDPSAFLSLWEGCNAVSRSIGWT